MEGEFDITEEGGPGGSRMKSQQRLQELPDGRRGEPGRTAHAQTPTGSAPSSLHATSPALALGLQRAVGNRLAVRLLSDGSPLARPTAERVQRMKAAIGITVKKTGLSKGDQIKVENMVRDLLSSGYTDEKELTNLWSAAKGGDVSAAEKLIAKLVAAPDVERTDEASGGMTETEAAQFAAAHDWFLLTGWSYNKKADQSHSPKGKVYTDGKNSAWSADNTGHVGKGWKYYGGAPKSLAYLGTVTDETPYEVIARGKQRGGVTKADRRERLKKEKETKETKEDASEEED
jgi:hypothetical protein